MKKRKLGDDEAFLYKMLTDRDGPAETLPPGLRERIMKEKQRLEEEEEKKKNRRRGG